MAVVIESLDREGRGIAHAEGKAIFIEGGLPGETVSYSTYRKKPSYEIASTTAVHEPSAARERPLCAHFDVCGGCSMQHLELRSQVAVKQRVLEDSLWHIGKVRAETLLRAVYGQAWGYRHRARLSARFVAKKGGVLIGFHERRSSFVAEMVGCEILPRRISELIVPLRRLIGGFSNASRLPQIELAVGEEVAVLVLRILEPLGRGDEEALAFGTPGGDQQDQWSLQFFLKLVHHSMGLQQAIDSPAWHSEHAPSSFHPRQARPGHLALEARLPEPTQAELEHRGHRVEIRPPWSEGRLCACALNRTGGTLLLRAAANPRLMQNYAVGR